MTYIPRIQFFQLSRISDQDVLNSIEQRGETPAKDFLSIKFDVPADNIEVDLKNQMSIIRYS